MALYIVKQKSESFLNERNVKVTKRSRAYRGYASTYNVKILNSFNAKLQLKDGLKIVTTLVLEFEKKRK